MNNFLNIVEKIKANNQKREEHNLSNYARKSIEAIQDPNLRCDDTCTDLRSAFSHDIDRIIHCHSYSRYMDKTQVFFLVDNDHITKRASHVQMVSRIARTIGRALRLNEDLIEAIALGHDLGHTPFGHAGEAALSRIMENKNKGSFLHNAQSVRLLKYLEHRGWGLNITLETLDGILGHNGEISQQKLKPQKENLTWEILEENLEKCLLTPTSKHVDRNIQPSTLEGCVVRFSDIISYLGRDIEDALLLKLITREDLPYQATTICGFSNRSIIDFFCKDIIENSFEKNYIAMSQNALYALNTLKEFNYTHIYQHPILREQIDKFSNMVTSLFEAYLSDITIGNKNSDIFKDFIDKFEPASNYIQKTSSERIVCDYIAMMTDDFFMAHYSRRFLVKKLEYYKR